MKAGHTVTTLWIRLYMWRSVINGEMHVDAWQRDLYRSNDPSKEQSFVGFIDKDWRMVECEYEI